jgi:hypothetical protein
VVQVTVVAMGRGSMWRACWCHRRDKVFLFWWNIGKEKKLFEFRGIVMKNEPVLFLKRTALVAFLKQTRRKK